MSRNHTLVNFNMTEFIKAIVMIMMCMAMAIAQVTFTDVTQETFGDTTIQGSGIAWGDYNNDGFEDVFLTGRGLFRNNGDATFTDVSEDVGIEIDDHSRFSVTGVAWADIDNDGYLDVCRVGDVGYDNRLWRNNGDTPGASGTFTDISASAGIITVPTIGIKPIWGDYDNDGFVDLFFSNGAPLVFLFRNNGNRTFSDVTVAAGLYGPYGGGAEWADYDNDGDLDLFIAPDGDKNYFFENRGDGTFMEVTEESGLNRVVDNTGSRGSVVWGDYDNDGYLDLYEAIVRQSNYLYKNKGDGTFMNVTAEAGSETLEDSLGDGLAVAWGDYDNDGYLDLYLVGMSDIDNLPDHLFRNNGDGTFTDAATEAEVGAEGNWGIAWCDYDNDGDIDLILSTFNGSIRLLKNNGNLNNWLQIRLSGTLSNRAGIGAKVIMVSENLSQMREVSGGSGLFDQSSLPVEFGLGLDAIVDSLIIRWPSGIVDTYTNIDVNQFFTAIEGDTIITAIDDIPLDRHSVPVNFQLFQNYPNPFNSTTKIRYDLASNGKVKIKIYNLLGEEVMTLVDATQVAGTYEVLWNGKNDKGSDVASGLYLYRIQAGNFVQSKKLVFLR